MTAMSVMNAGVNFVKSSFWIPTRATLSEVVQGCFTSFTQDDIKNCLWDALICSAPMIAGGTVAYAINDFAHRFFPENRKLANLCSFVSTAASFMIGAAISYQLASRLKLNPFPADKALKLATMFLVGHTASSLIFPLKVYTNLAFSALPLAAVAGYFGQRSLFVIGLLSSLEGSLACSKVWKWHRR